MTDFIKLEDGRYLNLDHIVTIVPNDQGTGTAYGEQGQWIALSKEDMKLFENYVSLSYRTAKPPKDLKLEFY